MATQGLYFLLWVEVVLRFVGDVVVLVIVDVDVGDMDIFDVDVVDDLWSDFDRLVIDECLGKPGDGQVLVQDHSSNEEVLEEDALVTFDTNVTTSVSDISAAPVERAVVL